MSLVRLAAYHYYLRSAKHILTPTALKSVYYALVHSHLIYGIQIWSFTNSSNLNSLVLKQKNALRIINLAKYNSHTQPLFKKSNILPFNMLVEYFKLLFMYNFINNTLPISFNNTWVLNQERNRNEDRAILRNQNELFIPFSRLMSSDNHPLFSFPRIWRDFPENDIKSCTNLNEFKSKAKNYFLSKLPENYVCERLLCPHCHLNA